MRTLERLALVEIWDERFFYFVAKFGMNFVATAKKAACLSTTVQIDVENTERPDINFVKEDGTKQHPILMLTSVSGSVDRNVFAILEGQARREARGESHSSRLAPGARRASLGGAHRGGIAAAGSDGTSTIDPVGRYCTADRVSRGHPGWHSEPCWPTGPALLRARSADGMLSWRS